MSYKILISRSSHVAAKEKIEYENHPFGMEANAANRSINLQLYKAAAEDGIESIHPYAKTSFHQVKVLESTIFHQFSPLRNTLLRSASKFGNVKDHEASNRTRSVTSQQEKLGGAIQH